MAVIWQVLFLKGSDRPETERRCLRLQMCLLWSGCDLLLSHHHQYSPPTHLPPPSKKRGREEKEKKKQREGGQDEGRLLFVFFVSLFCW